MTDHRRNRARRAHDAARAPSRPSDPDWSRLQEARQGMPTSNADRRWNMPDDYPTVPRAELDAIQPTAGRATARRTAKRAARTWHWAALLVVGLGATWALSSVALGDEPPTAGASAPAPAACTAEPQQLRALYVRGTQQPDRTGQVMPAFRTVTAQIDAMFAGTGMRSEGRPMRFAPDDRCATVVQTVVVPQAAMTDAASITAELRRLGFQESRATHLFWYESEGCGIAPGNQRPGATDPGAGFAGLGRDCWNLQASTRELLRALGTS